MMQLTPGEEDPELSLRVFFRLLLKQFYEPLFAEGSYGYRPNRSAKDAILKVKEYAEQGYTFAVVLDLSKYFDTLNHEILINLLRKNVKDERVVQLIKSYLKSGVTENGVVIDTEEGSPQGGNLSPLPVNVYLNEFDQEFLKRDVPCIRYADDIVLLAKSKRASERLLESSTKYLEERLKLTVNREKSRTVSVFAIRNFKFLGFALGRNGKGIYVRVHPKSWKKFKSRLKELSSRKQCQSIKPSLEKIKVYAREFSHSLPVCARQLLKAPYTERYVRCCERTAVSHRLLLDFRICFSAFGILSVNILSACEKAD